jgi:hypothetical protein
MIADLLKKTELLEHVKAWKSLVVAARAGIKNGEDKALEAAAKYGWKEEDLALLEDYLTKAEQGFDHKDDAVYIAPEEELSVIQTIMENAYFETGMVEKSGGQNLASGVPAITNNTLKLEVKPSSGQSLFYTKFDEPNPRFITAGIKAIAYRKLHGRYTFSNNPTTFALAKRARLVLVGDWGSGIDRADLIAKLMADAVKDADDRQCHVVHLGDIYFCGWPEEAQERFLDHWPVKPGDAAFSWCLNGNHDMYCGGEGYFKIVLGDSRFKEQGGCSYFALENEHWQILGLDTAYEEWKLEGNQFGWAVQQRFNNPAKKGILLSHHQPFSDYEKSAKSDGLAETAAALLKENRTTAWLWGHEHRCVVYKSHDFAFKDGTAGKLPFGACLGNGGVPTHATKPVNNPTSLHAETGSFRVGLEKFGLFGFAILDIDGDSAELTVVNENGAKSGPFKVA